MHLQNWIHKITEGSPARFIRFTALILGFIALASAYNMYTRPEFSGQDAMETAQVARNLAEGQGYTTLSIRPLALSLQKKSGTAMAPLHLPLPDLSTPPAYPALLAGYIKLLPFHFTNTPRSLSSLNLELWITGLNQALFLAAILLVFNLARTLFDRSVAWAAAALFGATDLMWRFSASGLPTMFLILIFLAIVWCLMRIEARNSAAQPQAAVTGLFPAFALGALVAIGGLTAYSFALLIIPVLLFLALGIPRSPGKLCLAATISFLVILTPWLARNYSLSGTFFGTSSYAIFQNTPAFPNDSIERSLDAHSALTRIAPQDIVNKFATNTKTILQNDLPKLGGNWLSAFFLVGLLIPFKKTILSKIRFFLLGSAILFIAVQAVGQTHLTLESPEINSENLLVFLAPMLFVFGAGFYFTLIDQAIDLNPDARMAATAAFGALLCAPFILTFLAPPAYKAADPSNPGYIQWLAQWFGEKDPLMSDVPSAIAWHGRRPCLWLTLNHQEEFSKLQAIMPIHGLYLTQRTTDHFLSRNAKNKASWERFALECWAHGEVPDRFPLTKAPLGFLPDRIFLSDTERWFVKETKK